MKIVLEGNEFVGKTTTGDILKENFGHNVSRQPGNENLRKFIKEDILNNNELEELPENILTLAYALDRLYQQKVEEKDIIIDRSVLSSFILQSRNTDTTLIAAVNNLIKIPDLIIWLRMTDDELKRRIKTRGIGSDAYDKAAFKNKLRYEKIMPVLRTKLDTDFIEIFVDNKTPFEVAKEVDYHIRKINDENDDTIGDKFKKAINEMKGRLPWT